MAVTETRMSVAEEVWGLLFQLALGNRSRLVAALDGLGLTFPQAHLLRLLAPEAPMPMHELAARLVCDASNVTGLADRLEARGLIERRSDAHDRRVKALALTAAGEAVRDEVIRVMNTPPPAIAGLARADQLALRTILRRALDRAARRSGTGPAGVSRG
jgi:DNA-binding MarR family transcriptional regulator